MQVMHEKRSFRGLNVLNLKFCEHYIFSKQRIVIFNNSGSLLKNRLELVHIDAHNSQVMGILFEAQIRCVSCI